MPDPFELIHDNKILMEEARKKSLCSLCNGKLFKMDIIARNIQDVSFQKLKFHLHCFRPLLETPIKVDQITILVKEPLNRNKIKNWIKKWNWSLRIKDPEVSDIFTKAPKKLLSKYGSSNPLSSLGRQNIIQILSFLSVDEIIYVVKFISADFYEICWNSHLWKKLCSRDFTRKTTSQLKRSNKEINWFPTYFRLRRIICFYCKKKKRTDLKYCPIEKKPICKECRQKEEFQLLTLCDIKNYYGVLLWHIFDNYIDKCAQTCFGDKVFYKRDVENAFKSYQNFQNKSI